MSLPSQFETIFGDALSSANSIEVGDTPASFKYKDMTVPFPYYGEVKRLTRQAQDFGSDESIYTNEEYGVLYLAGYHLWRNDVSRLRDLINNTFADNAQGRSLTNAVNMHLELPDWDISSQGYVEKYDDDLGIYAYGRVTDGKFEPVLEVNNIGEFITTNKDLQSLVDSLVKDYSLRTEWGYGTTRFEEIGHPNTQDFDFCVNEARKVAYDLDVLTGGTNIQSDITDVREAINKINLWQYQAEEAAEKLTSDYLPPSMSYDEIGALQDAAEEVLDSWDELFSSRFISDNVSETYFDTANPRVGAIPLGALCEVAPLSEKEADLQEFVDYLSEAGLMRPDAIFGASLNDEYTYGGEGIDITSDEARQAFYVAEDDVREKWREHKSAMDYIKEIHNRSRAFGDFGLPDLELGQ